MGRARIFFYGDAILEIRVATIEDAAGWLTMRLALWPYCKASVSRVEMDTILADPRQVALLAEDDELGLVGFAELSIHPHVDGCETNPVAYLEGWWVDARVRNRGVGRLLVEAAERWGRDQGCQEIASDTWLDNDVSDRAHRALGFVESSRLIHYRKWL